MTIAILCWIDFSFFYNDGRWQDYLRLFKTTPPFEFELSVRNTARLG